MTQRVMVVIGGASGIGLATAQQAVAQGWRVVIVDRQDPLEPLPAEQLRCDLVNDPEALSALERLADREHEIDALVITAGGAINGRFDALPSSTWDQYFSNDTLVVLRPARALLPAIQRAAKARGIADIVVLGSIASATAFEDAVVYGAVAAARNALGEQLRVELRTEQIRARTIMTGFVATPLTDSTRTPAVTQPIMAAPLRAEDVAGIIHHGVNLPPDVTVHDVVVVPTVQGWA